MRRLASILILLCGGLFGAKRIKLVDGKPVFIPVFEPGIRVGQLVDALLSFGEEPDESVAPPAGLYADTEYGREIQRRRNILLSWRPQ